MSRRWDLPTWLRWGGLDLVEPGEEGAAPLVPGPVAAGFRRARTAWRWWMVGPLVALLLVTAAVVRVPVDLVWPGDVVEVGQVVSVTVPNDRAGPADTGTYLAPRQVSRPSLLGWLGALLPGGAVVEDQSPAVVNGFSPLEVALLTGAGVSPGRGDAPTIGLFAEVDAGKASPAGLGVALAVFDAAARLDLGAGRRVLALGAFRADGTITCPAGAQDTITAVVPDTIVMAPDCPRLSTGTAAVIRATGLPDAVVALSAR